MSESTESKSLQELYAPGGTCFGCGQANQNGLQIRSFFEDEETVCFWTAKKQHEAFDGFLNGGIISSLLDCHCNWAAIASYIRETGSSEVPCTVTAKLQVEFVAPTPTTNPIRLTARVTSSSSLGNSSRRKFNVAGEIVADGIVTARCQAVFVEVGPGHPAYHRW